MPIYQYAFFPNATSEISGHESIWAQSFIYNSRRKKRLWNKFNQSKLKYTKVTRKKTNHQLLCGNSMKLDTVNNYPYQVLGSNSGTLKEEEVEEKMMECLQRYLMFIIGYTYFLQDDDAYNQFLSLMKDKKALNDVLECIIPEFIMDTWGRCCEL